LDILNSEGTIDENKVKKYKEAKGGPTSEQLKQLTKQRDDLQTKLTNANNLISSASTKLNINDLNSLKQLPSGETVNSLLQRPTQQQLQGKDSQIRQLTNQVANLQKVDQQLNNARTELAQVKNNLAN